MAWLYVHVDLRRIKPKVVVCMPTTSTLVNPCCAALFRVFDHDDDKHIHKAQVKTILVALAGTELWSASSGIIAVLILRV